MFREQVISELVIDLRIAYTRRNITYSLDYDETRCNVLLFSRIKSAITRNLLNVQNPGLALQLEQYRQLKNDETKCCNNGSVTSYWEWWWPRQPKEKKDVIINTCEELEDLSKQHYNQMYCNLKLVRICLGEQFINGEDS